MKNGANSSNGSGKFGVVIEWNNGIRDVEWFEDVKERDTFYAQARKKRSTKKVWRKNK